MTPNEQDYSRFMQFLPFIFEHEGTTFEDDPDDPGGATKFGIDQRSHPNVRIRDLTAAMAADIYWKEWNEAGCQNLASPLAECYFDTQVNCGLGRAVRWYQQALSEHDRADVLGIATSLLNQREDFYHSLSTIHPKMTKFLRGWLNRVGDLRDRFGVKK